LKPFLPLREVVFRRRYEPMGWQRSHADTLATYLVGTKVNPDSIAMRQAWECFKRCVEQWRRAHRLRSPT